MLSRSKTAAVLQLTEAGIRLLDKRGELHPVKQDDGTFAYHEKEVEAVRADRLRTNRLAAKSADGALTARVFARLNAGERLTDIVVNEQLPASVVRGLAASWRDLQAEDMNAASVPAVVARMQRQMKADGKRLNQVIAAHNALAQRVYALPVTPALPCEACGSVPAEARLDVRCSSCGGRRDLEATDFGPADARAND